MTSTLRYSKYLKEINLAGDVISLNITFLFTYYIFFNSLYSIISSNYFELLLFYNISWIASAYMLKIHDLNRTLSLEKIFKRLLNALGLYLIIIFAFIGLKNNSFQKVFVFQSYCFTSLGVTLFHFILVISLKYYRKIGYNYRRVLIAGYGDIAIELRKFFTFNPEYGYKFFGYFDDNFGSQNIVGKIDNLYSYALEKNIDEIYCVLPYINHNKVNDIINFAEDNLIKIKIIPDFRGFPFKGVDVTLYDYIPVLNLHEQPLDDSLNIFIKRLFDIVFSLLVIIFLLSWLFPLISMIIKFSSTGPILYKQKRSGKNYIPFTCYKFRTMYRDNNTKYIQATKRDPRITKIGRFLRKTSLDELPQFFNVLKGDMSIIGPRPHPIQLNEQFNPVIKKYMLRHSIKPGITGLAQAKGYRGETKTVQMMKNRVKLDRFYMENWSLILDIKIIFLTIVSLFKGDENAY